MQNESGSATGGLVDQPAQRLGRHVPGVPCNPSASALCEHTRVPRREEERLVTQRLAMGRYVAEDDGGAAGGGFDRRQTEALRERGKHDGGRSCVQAGECVVRDKTREQDVIPESKVR